MNKIGLIPAAGYARRLGKIGGSKEMLPVNGKYGEEPVCHSLVRQFESAGIDQVVMITRRDKRDLVSHFECYLDLNVDIEMLVLEQSNSTLESICSAHEYIRDKEVYLGFPDMILSPENAMNTLTSVKEQSSAEVLLGAVPANDPGKVDMIDIGPDNKLIDVVIKDPRCSYKYTWVFACWTDQFTEYLNRLYRHGDLVPKDKEIYIGDVFRSYLNSGQDIEVHCLECGKYLDIGTPEDIASLAKLKPV